jgi:hypothetical protein
VARPAPAGSNPAAPSQSGDDVTQPARSVEQTVADYIASWNEGDPARRAELIAAVWRSDGHYLDPMTEAVGRQRIEAMIAALHQQLPDCAFTLVGPLQQHHDVARFRWQLGPAGGAPLVSGLDVAFFAADGRLRRLVGFFDEPAAAPEQPA